MKKSITRLILIGLMFMLTVGLCACSSSDETSTEGDERTLTVFNYGDYIDTDVLAQFEEETGITVKYEEYVTPEDMYTKYTNGGIHYDVICTSDYMLEKMIQNDELLAVESEKMSQYGNLDPMYLDFCQTFDPDNRYAVPYFWGTVGILYNTEMVEETPDSWEVFYDAQYQNLSIVQNSMRDAFIIPLKLAGKSLNTKDEGILEQCKTALLEQKPYTMAYLVDETRDVMALGDGAVAQIYSGDATVAMEVNEDLDYVLPKEGSNIWFDCWAIPKTAQHREAARQFIDFLCRPDIAMKNFEYIYYGTPNAAVKAMLDKETLADQTIFPDEDALKKCEVYRYLGDETEQFYNRMWKEIKSY